MPARIHHNRTGEAWVAKNWFDALVANMPEAETFQINSGLKSGRALYRVRIGPLVSLTEAGRIAARITSLGLGEPRLMLD